MRTGFYYATYSICAFILTPIISFNYGVAGFDYGGIGYAVVFAVLAGIATLVGLYLLLLLMLWIRTRARKQELAEANRKKEISAKLEQLERKHKS